MDIFDFIYRCKILELNWSVGCSSKVSNMVNEQFRLKQKINKSIIRYTIHPNRTTWKGAYNYNTYYVVAVISINGKR
jgi:hypothetical protein